MATVSISKGKENMQTDKRVAFGNDVQPKTAKFDVIWHMIMSASQRFDNLAKYLYFLKLKYFQSFNQFLSVKEVTKNKTFFKFKTKI